LPTATAVGPAPILEPFALLLRDFQGNVRPLNHNRKASADLPKKSAKITHESLSQLYCRALQQDPGAASEVIAKGLADAST